MAMLGFQLLAERAQDLIYRYRVLPSYAMEYISRAATTILGSAPEEFYGDPELPFKLIHPQDRPTAFRMREKPADFQDPVRLRWCRPDGGIVWVEHCNVPIYDDAGRLIAIEGIGRDITQMLAVKSRLLVSEAQLRELAKKLQNLREEERTNLARELHDELGQVLTCVRIDLDRMVAAARRGATTDVESLVQAARNAIDVASDTVRRLSRELRPPALDQLGLVAAIEMEAAALQRRSGIRFRISSPAAPLRLNNEQSTAVFRIVQEAFTNIVRHSRASAVRIRIRMMKRIFRLEIHDNGRGITPAELGAPASLGLLGMRERAHMINGAVMITGDSGAGTRVVIAVPLKAIEEVNPRATSAAR
jgi:two-component system, NarL family, sensor histidine kinase UhpB